MSAGIPVLDIPDEPKAGSAPVACKVCGLIPDNKRHCCPPIQNPAPVEKAGEVDADRAWQTEREALTALRSELAAKDAEIEERIGRGVRTYDKLVVARADLKARCDQLAQAKEEIAKLTEKERMVDASISVLAMSNTRDTLKGNKLPRENPYWTPAQDDVEKAIVREIDHREARERAEARVRDLQSSLEWATSSEEERRAILARKAGE